MVKDQRHRERLLECFKGFSAAVREVPWDVFPSKPSKQKNNFGIIMNETPIEIGESEITLDLLDVFGHRPLNDCLDFLGIHSNFSLGYYHTEVLN